VAINHLSSAKTYDVFSVRRALYTGTEPCPPSIKENSNSTTKI